MKPETRVWYLMALCFAACVVAGSLYLRTIKSDVHEMRQEFSSFKLHWTKKDRDLGCAFDAVVNAHKKTREIYWKCMRKKTINLDKLILGTHETPDRTDGVNTLRLYYQQYGLWE